MSKYEIDLVVSGSLDENKIDASIKELTSLIDKLPNFKVDAWGKKDLAYKIGKDTQGYYFIYTFECDKPAILAEFLRLANINPTIIRKMIINVEKEYGYKANKNEKKAKRAKTLNEKYLATKAAAASGIVSKVAKKDGDKSTAKKTTKRTTKKVTAEDDE